MFSHVLAAVLLTGCSHLSATNEPTGIDILSTPTPTDGNTDTTGDGQNNLPSQPPLAGGLTISKISIYQGVESVLFENGHAPTTLEVPIVTGRDGLLRVFVKPKPSFENRKIDAILTLSDNGGDTELHSKIQISGASTDANPASTFNFDLTGDLLGAKTTMKLELREIGVHGPGGGDAKSSSWKSEKEGGLDLEATDTLYVKVVPVRYNADGSGRLPDTGQSNLNAIEDEVRAFYPVQDVVVLVDSPFDWNQTISANGGGWSQLLDSIVNYRGNKNEDPNTYYYAAFEPKSSFYTFCAQGCVAGLSYIGYLSQPATRASIGVGYPGWTADTLIHEMGHAHGREHAPCGGAAGPDPDYPYSGAKIGSWGYDILSGKFADPNKYVDMMSYCTPIWISDYNFYALMDRIQAVSRQNFVAPAPHQTLTLDPDGVTTMGSELAFEDTSAAPRIEVQLFDEDSLAAGTTTAAFLPYDHLAGGMVILDEDLPEGWTAKAVSP